MLERAERRVGCSYVEVLIAGEIHVILSFEVVNFGRPIPAAGGNVLFFEGQSFTLPVFQVRGGIYFYPMVGVGSIGVIGVVFHQYVRVGQGQLAFLHGAGLYVEVAAEDSNEHDQDQWAVGASFFHCTLLCLGAKIVFFAEPPPVSGPVVAVTAYKKACFGEMSGFYSRI